MQQFLIRMGLFFLPVLLVAILLEMAIRQVPNEYAYKNDYLEEHAAETEKLFLGSSHTYFGVNPDWVTGKGFNAGHLAQTLDYDNAIFRKFPWPKLQYLYIPIDHFTLFSKIGEGPERQRVKNYHLYYDLHLSCQWRDHFELTSEQFRKSIRKLYLWHVKGESLINCTPLGYSATYGDRQGILDSLADPIRTEHILLPEKHWEEHLALLTAMVAFAKERGIQVILYSSPAFRTHTAEIDKDQWLKITGSVSRLAADYDNCQYFDLMKRQGFLRPDYRDDNHLNDAGAEKLSQLLDALATQ